MCVCVCVCERERERERERSGGGHGGGEMGRDVAEWDQGFTEVRRRQRERLGKEAMKSPCSNVEVSWEKSYL